ncbi:MAG: hypothetical protein ACRDOK_27720, partial [Streptosporangiaceae bacterium]
MASPSFIVTATITPQAQASPELFDVIGTLLATSIAGGADLQIVRERLSHGSIATTEKYLHTLPEADETALAALSRIRGRATEDPLQHRQRETGDVSAMGYA